MCEYIRQRRASDKLILEMKKYLPGIKGARGPPVLSIQLSFLFPLSLTPLLLPTSLTDYFLLLSLSLIKSVKYIKTYKRCFGHTCKVDKRGYVYIYIYTLTYFTQGIYYLHLNILYSSSVTSTQP